MSIFTNLGMGPEQYDNDYRKADSFMQRHFGLRGAVSVRDNLDIEMRFTGNEAQAIIFKNFMNYDRHYVLVDPKNILILDSKDIGSFDIEKSKSNFNAPSLEMFKFDCNDFSKLPWVHYSNIQIRTIGSIKDFTTLPESSQIKVEYSSIESLKGLNPKVNKLIVHLCPLHSLEGIPNGMDYAEFTINDHKDIDRLAFTIDGLPKTLFLDYFCNTRDEKKELNIKPVTIEHLKNIDTGYDVQVYFGGNCTHKIEYRKKDGYGLSIYI